MGLASPGAYPALSRKRPSSRCTTLGTDLPSAGSKPAAVPASPRPDHVRERREQFGDMVRERRLAAGLSQEALAERCGIDRKSISRMETGAFSPRLDSVFNVAEALNIPVGELFEVVRRDDRRNARKRG
jgi:putative transcriptional regulator